jgi:hypothetical protein
LSRGTHAHLNPLVPFFPLPPSAVDFEHDPPRLEGDRRDFHGHSRAYGRAIGSQLGIGFGLIEFAGGADKNAMFTARQYNPGDRNFLRQATDQINSDISRHVLFGAGEERPGAQPKRHNSPSRVPNQLKTRNSLPQAWLKHLRFLDAAKGE